MAKNPLIPVLLGLVLLVGAASVQGRNLGQIRQADAFYQWVIGAATSERLFDEEADQEYQDRELLLRVAEKADAQLPEVEVEGDPTPMNRLAAAVREGTHDDAIWQIARSASLADERNDFIDYARNKKLLFGNQIQYADVQGAGVNIFNLFFGFRKIAANFIWLQVDRYWHMGLMHRMIPLMKTCVVLDPNFVDAYLLGAWHLGYNIPAGMDPTPKHLREWHPKYKICVGEKEKYYYAAVDYLKGGIRNNPRNYKLYFDLGFAYYKEKLKDYENAVKYLSEAVRQPHERWVPRQLYICQMLNGQYEEALAGWQDYLEKFPENLAAPRFIERNKGLLFEERAREARHEAQEVSDPEEKKRLLAEAAELTERAREVWQNLDDPFAKARLKRLDAIELANQGRYREAIAVLDHARWESNQIFEEASNMIIEYKQTSGIELSLSERMAVMRRAEPDVCEGMPPEVREERLQQAGA